jgi:hypothetical protein
MVEEDDDPKGECNTGYQNVLCADCEYEYSRSGTITHLSKQTLYLGDFICGGCPEAYLNALRLVGIFILAILIIMWMVRSTLIAATQKKSLQSIYLRIFMNHLQLIVLTASFNLDWPQLVNYKLLFSLII